MDFRSILRSKQFFLEGKEENARLCYTNTERFGEKDEDDNFDDWSSSLETARKMLQISKKWEQEYDNFNFQPSGNSSNEQDNLTAKQVMTCFSENICWKMQNQKIWQFAMSKLESYGFYESHCVQASICTDGDLEDALEMLFYKYYNIKDILKIEDSEIPSATKLLKIRQEEKQNLEYTFYDAFHEKIENRVWIVQLQLRYLISSTPIPENSYFTLEIRFPKECIYPYEPPYIYFYKNKGTFPRIKCLRIARRLHDEALLYSMEGIPSIHSVISLLKNENEIKVYLEENREPFLHPFETLYEKRREERKTKDEYMKEFEIMRDMMEREEERMVNCKSLYAREQRKEEEIICDLLELTKEREKNEDKEEESMSAPYVHEPLFARELEKKEESVINPNIRVPSYVGESEKREGNIFNPHAVELYAKKPVKQEGSMVNRHVLESEELEKTEKNIVNSNVFVPSYAEEPEKSEGNMFSSHAVEPLYTEEPKKQEESIINLFEPLYEGGPQKREENIDNSNILVPSYADKSEKREGNIFNSHEVVPLYAGGPKSWEGYMLNPNVLVPQYTRREKQEENIVNLHILEPSYAGVPKGNMINFNVLMSLYGEKLERTEGNMFNLHVVKPLYATELEKLEKSIVNPLILEPLYAGAPEKKEGNIANPNVLALSYTREPEKKEGNVLNSHESYFNDFSVTNFYKFNSIIEYKDHNKLPFLKKGTKKRQVYASRKNAFKKEKKKEFL